MGRMRSLRICLLVLTCASAHTAEPTVDPSRDLPRVPATSPGLTGGSFQVKAGFELQQVAAEPLVVDPVALDFDEDGRLFVAEMRDYSERRDEKLGRIRVLEDTDGDGRFDRSWVYAEGFAWPTAVLCYGGGVFVGATPDLLFLKDADGDHHAEIRETVFTGFAEGSLQRLNVQALMNSLRWGVDQRIHGSASLSGGRITSPRTPGAKPLELRGRDFSFNPRTFEIRAETGGGQHGMSFDNEGSKFLCSNSDHIQAVLVEDRYLQGGTLTDPPAVRESIAADGPAAEVFRISPDEPWRVIRTRWRVTGAVPGIVEGGGRPSGYFTGATGATVYRGDAFPADYLGDVFVADCGSNLIHHKKLRRRGVRFVAERPADELRSEFVASRDNWFRPVQFANAPDGGLYVADMYRETIEHPWSLPEGIKKHLDLNSGNDRGRIYRIVPIGFKARPRPRLSAASSSELVALLAHPNGWHRDVAARLLFERQDPATRGPLELLARTSVSELGRMHALRVLESVGGVGVGVVEAGLRDGSAVVRRHALKVAEGLDFLGSGSLGLRAAMRLMVDDQDPAVSAQLAWTLHAVTFDGKEEMLRAFVERHAPEPGVRAPILAAMGALASPLLAEGVAGNGKSRRFDAWLLPMARALGARGRETELSQVRKAFAAATPERRTLDLLLGLAVGLSESGSSLARWDPSRQLVRHYEYILSIAAAEGATAPVEEEQAVAIRLLGHLDSVSSTDVLGGALARTGRPQVQRAAVQAVGQLGQPGLGAVLVAAWSGLEVGLRSEVLGLMLRRPAWRGELVLALEQGRISRADLARDQVQQLKAVGDAPLRQRVETLFGSAAAENRQELVNRFLPALTLVGDPRKGAQTFEQRCMVCHRLGGKGNAVGPDLESVRSMGKDKLLTQILDPNREVAPNYLSYEVETRGGETLTGLIAAETADQIRLRGAGGMETMLRRDQIVRQKALGLSLMPEGLAEGMSTQEMADLLEWVGATR